MNINSLTGAKKEPLESARFDPLTIERGSAACWHWRERMREADRDERVRILHFYPDEFYLQQVDRPWGRFYELRNQYSWLLAQSWDRNALEGELSQLRAWKERRRLERQRVEAAARRAEGGGFTANHLMSNLLSFLTPK